MIGLIVFGVVYIVLSLVWGWFIIPDRKLSHMAMTLYVGLSQLAGLLSSVPLFVLWSYFFGVPTP